MSQRFRRLCTAFGLVSISLLIALAYGEAAGDLSPSEARKLIANLAGIKLPSSAVRVKEISPLGTSAVVLAQVETAFRFVREDGKWRVAEIRTGDRRWEDVELLVRAVNAEKVERARAELETLATALEAFRRERGFYVAGETEGALVDQLNPRYLARIIRVDPWHNPYLYEGTAGAYTLRSAGPDGKEKTADDLVRQHPGTDLRNSQ